MINFILFVSIESVGLCSVNDTTNGQSLMLITFDSGGDQYSMKIPSSFNFSTTHRQTFKALIDGGMFAFVNTVPNNRNVWHTGALDHTAMDQDGYMFLVNVANGKDSQLFNSTVNGLCIGLRYEFSAYLANIVKRIYGFPKPNVRFEVRAQTVQKDIVAQTITGDIPEYNLMTWSKHGLSFIASSTSVTLLMISNVQADNGNDLAIDDIELRVCSTTYSGFCPSG
jgi:hypothetical protein